MSTQAIFYSWLGAILLTQVREYVQNQLWLDPGNLWSALAYLIYFNGIAVNLWISIISRLWYWWCHIIFLENASLSNYFKHIFSCDVLFQRQNLWVVKSIMTSFVYFFSAASMQDTEMLEKGLLCNICWHDISLLQVKRLVRHITVP